MTMKNKLMTWAMVLLCLCNTLNAAEVADDSAKSDAVYSASAPASVKEASDLAALLSSRYPNTHFSGVKPSPVAHLFEVTMGHSLAYVDSTGEHFVFGHIYDMARNKDLTADVVADLNKIDPSSLPVGDAIVTVKGDGSRIVNLFSDPVCHFCQQFEHTLDGMTNVRIQTWLVPLQPGSDELAKKIWCAADRNKAWRAWMLGRSEPQPTPSKCDTSALQRNLELAQRLQTAGTPTIISGSGRVHSGAMDSSELSVWLASDHSPADGSVSIPE